MTTLAEQDVRYWPTDAGLQVLELEAALETLVEHRHEQATGGRL